MAEENEMKFEVVEYISKISSRVGITKTGSNWELFILSFFNNKKNEKLDINCFDSVGMKEGSKSIKISDLVVGKLYKIGIVTDSKGTQCKYLSPFEIKNPMNEGTKPLVTKNFDGKTGELLGIELQTESPIFLEFCREYIKQMKTAKKELSMVHFVGAFVVKFEREVGQDFVVWMKELYKKEVEAQKEINI